MTDIRAELRRAQAKASELFRELEHRQLIRAAETEASISNSIFELALQLFDTRKHWHQRLVRSGPNTRLPFAAVTPDRRIEPDDLVSIDLGPVFDEHEADFGRSYVIGSAPDKLHLRAELAVVFEECQRAYLARPSMTGAQLYAYVVERAAARGFGFGGTHAGHLIGAFPVSRAERDAARNRIRPDNHVPMDAPSESGETRHWILEVHLLDAGGAFGGFFEDHLNL